MLCALNEDAIYTYNYTYTYTLHDPSHVMFVICKGQPRGARPRRPRRHSQACESGSILGGWFFRPDPAVKAEARKSSRGLDVKEEGAKSGCDDEQQLGAAGAATERRKPVSHWLRVLSVTEVLNGHSRKQALFFAQVCVKANETGKFAPQVGGAGNCKSAKQLDQLKL